MAEFVIKQFDTLPILSATLLDADDNAVNLAGATIRFIMRTPDDAVLINAPAVIVDAFNGKVQYAWQLNDTKFNGQYLGEFKVTFSDGSVETWPNDVGGFTTQITKALRAS